MHSIVVFVLLALAGCTTAGMQTSASLVEARETTSRDEASFPRGNAMRGREVVAGRDGNCLLCHAIAETGAQFMGNLGPALSGVGARLSEAQLRARLINPQQLNPDTIMPAYARTEGLTQVGKVWRGKPLLTTQQIEDVVAFLATLR